MLVISNHPGILKPALMLIGRLGAWGKIKRIGCASCSWGTRGAKSWPSAPSPCNQMTAPTLGAVLSGWLLRTMQFSGIVWCSLNNEAVIVRRPQAAFVCIGDEILSGRTRDSNIWYLGSWLNTQGIQLAEVRVIADDKPAIGKAVNELRASYDYVFTSGGIGPTHDDITAESIASAFGIDLIEDPRAVRILEHTYSERGGITPARRRMTRMPQGVELIHGPQIGVPGFRIENVYVLAGVPSIFKAMLSVLADTVRGTEQWRERSIEALCGETTIAYDLAQVQKNCSEVQIGSYPKFCEQKSYHVHLVFRGPDSAAINAAVAQTTLFLENRSISFSDLGYSTAEPQTLC